MERDLGTTAVYMAVHFNSSKNILKFLSVDASNGRKILKIV